MGVLLRVLSLTRSAAGAFVVPYRILVGGAVFSWLACLTLDPVVRVQALAGDIVLCSSARHFTLTVPLST